MIYRIVKVIVKISLSVFFKKIVVTGREHIPDQGPMIIVANHPNTLMDPLIIASIIGQRVGFVANAGIFTNRILISIFRYFHVIPIFRKKDVADGEKPDNREAFVKCHEYLEQGNTLLIFPEGSSHYELKLRDIKTGTARIALSFEKLKNFESNLKILPVALDYSDSIQYRSMVAVTITAPLSVREYKDVYLRDEVEGVKELTDDIGKELAKNVPHTTGKEQENFLIRAHKFYTAYYEPDADLHENPKRSLELRKQISDTLHLVQSNNPNLYLDTQTKVNTFFNSLKSDGLTTGFFTNTFIQKNKTMVCLGYLFEFLLLLPFYIFGLLSNYLPYILPSKIFEAMKIDIEYKTSVEMASGIIVFPIFYAFETWLFRHYVSDNPWLAIIFLIMLPVSGYLVLYYWTEMQRFSRVVRFYFFITADQMKKLLELRDEILLRMEEARRSF